MKKTLVASLLLASYQLVFSQFEPTPFDLIRPTWPVTWDTAIFDTYVPNPKKYNAVPPNRTPAAYKPNDYIPDTLNQAYLDAMNLKIGRIRVNQAGYVTDDADKQFYYVGTATNFSIVDLNGKEWGTGTFSNSGQTTASSWTIIAGTDAATNDQIRYTAKTTGPAGAILVGKMPPGLPTDQRLRVKVGDELSADFIISDRTYSMVRDATLKFMGIARSGNSESWFHPASHTKDGAGTVVDIGGTPVAAITSAEGDHTGGWYDCGDHLKESQTQAYAFMALSVLAATNPGRDEDHYAFNQKEVNQTDGVPDMLREAKHGADFAINAYDKAGGVIDNMVLSVGNFGADHGWWGRPEAQDFIPVSTPSKRRGGPQDRDVRLGELGSNISGQFAAGLALLSKEYAPYDPVFAAKALKVSEEMYDFAKSLMLKNATYGGGKPFVYNTKAAGWSSAAYNGNNEAQDDLGLAAISLLYATGKTDYLKDAVETVFPGAGAQNKSNVNAPNNVGMFRGGWFAWANTTLWKSAKNTSWANAYAYTLYAFYKLILRTDAEAAKYGITNAQRLEYIEDVVYTMIPNLSSISLGSSTITLPSFPNYTTGSLNVVRYDPTWYSMMTDQDWIYNRYLAGNIFEVLAYADVTKDLEGVTLPQRGAQDWKSKEMRQLGLRQLDYMLGVNPWDVSFLLGVGDKNDAHPHHRGANPEGKNVPGNPYKYNPPTGALFGGVRPDAVNAWVPSNKSWEDYHLSETCIDATATFIASGAIASKETDRYSAPEVQVQIKYVGFDSTIVVVRQSFRGSTTINYGTTPTGLTETATTTTDGVEHTIVLKPLKNGTTYYFTATSTNALSGNASQPKYLVDSTQTPYTFTTLNAPPAAADIQNVKVCNVSADSAEVMWYTPNGEYESKIYWDTVLTSYDKMQWSKSGDIAGVPTKFHYMKIGGLKEKTTYYFAVESNGQVRAAKDDGTPLKFTTPVTQYDFEVRTYQYSWGGMSMMNINIFNNEARPFDSLTVRLYMRGTEAISKDIGIRMDICQAYDEAGFNNPCSPATITELTTNLRLAMPVKVEDTYDPADGTWQWYFPVPLGSTVIKSSSRMRIDVGFDQRSPWPPYLDLMNAAPNKKVYCQVSGGTVWHAPDVISSGSQLTANPGDWSWQPHSKANGEPSDYYGMPCISKDQGDIDFNAADVNPYVTVYRKGEFVWGFSPSYQEMTTKRANYELTSALYAPFNVSNGSYVQIDQTSSTVRVKGQAHVTEGGVINAIWVNGAKLTTIDSAAVYNAATDMWDLDIPVKLGIGANKVDVTVFAGPSLDCEPCQENGGCAFVNHNFFIQFAKPGMTKSSLTVKDVNTNEAVASPAVPGQTIFSITVNDVDKLKGKPSSLDVLVINSRKKDTLVVKLTLVGDVYTTSSPISAVSKDAAQTTGNEIAFFGGDTIYVRYVDPDDEEDISEQTFFAKPTFPTPIAANALDKNCDGITDQVDVQFAQAFSSGDKLDTVWIAVRDQFSDAKADSFAVTYSGALEGQSSISITLPVRETLPKTGAPAGTVTVKITPAVGASEVASVPLTDAIKPVFTGFTLLENIGHKSEIDTLKLSFSEPVALQSTGTWPVDLFNGATPVNTSSLVVVGAATTEDDGKSWMYAIKGNDGTMLAPGNKATISGGFVITDLARNQLDPDSGCASDVVIVEVPKPVPVTFAEMRDRDEDGSADELYMKFERKLRDKDMLDSFVVRWGKPSIIKSFLPPTPRQWVVGVDTSSHQERDPVDTTKVFRVIDTASTLSLTFADSSLYPYGTTQGEENGKGSVVPRLGPEGGFFDKSYPVTDVVGPVITQARKGENNARDSLAIVISEPVDTLNKSLILERRRGNSVSSFNPTSLVMNKSATYIRFDYDPESEDAVRVGDFVRLVSSGLGVKDKSNNAPGRESPWVEVRGAVSSDVGFKIDVVKNVTGGKPALIQAGYTEDEPESKDHFRVSLYYPDSSRERKLQDISNGSKSQIPEANFFGTDYTHLGPTFLVDIDLPGATVVRQVDGDTIFVWNYALDIKLSIFDNIGQYVNGMTYKLNLGDLNISSKCADLTSHPAELDQNVCRQLARDGRIDTVNNVDRTFIGADGKLHLRVEWMVHDKSAPKSLDGRIVGTGAYIGVFDMNAKAVAQVDDNSAAAEFEKGDVEKSKATKRRTFGLMRVK